MSRIDLGGVSAAAPPAWDVRIYRRPMADGEPTHTVLHGANFALPPNRGDYGSGAVETMGPSEVLVALLEFSPADATSTLFAHRGLPAALDPGAFSRASLQRALPNQAGLQVFFHQSARAFCLYVVLGSWAARSRLVPLASSFVGGIRIGASA